MLQYFLHKPVNTSYFLCCCMIFYLSTFPIRSVIIPSCLSVGRWGLPSPWNRITTTFQSWCSGRQLSSMIFPQLVTFVIICSLSSILNTSMKVSSRMVSYCSLVLLYNIVIIRIKLGGIIHSVWIYLIYCLMYWYAVLLNLYSSDESIWRCFSFLRFIHVSVQELAETIKGGFLPR